jgi:thiol-disulfide isomerase/thioredoxin
MKALLTTLVLIAATALGMCQDQTIVRGRITISPYSHLSIQSMENPVTATRDIFDVQLSDSGVFRIEADITVPQVFLLLVDERPVYQLFLCPNTETVIEVDTNSFSIKGPTEDFYNWGSLLANEYIQKESYSYYENQGYSGDSVMQIIHQIFDWREEALAQFQTKSSTYNLNSCESEYFINAIKYSVYTLLWSDLLHRGHSIESDAFYFLDELPLDDIVAASSSLEYNRALDVYVFWKLRLANHWYDNSDFDFYSDEFSVMFYDQILKELNNSDVRDVALTRKVCGSLFSGTTSADYLYSRYINDCSNPELKKIAARYYDGYLGLKDSRGEKTRIDTIDISLFHKLGEYKGKVLYLDFWASWCSPCMISLPLTKRIQEKYLNSPFEVIYVNVQDNIGSFETTAKRLDLTGELIYLNKEESSEILDYLKAKGIPHYVLIDKDGVMVESEAPGPETGAIIEKIDHLLEL